MSQEFREAGASHESQSQYSVINHCLKSSGNQGPVMTGRERQRETERDRERGREIETDRDRQRDRETEREC